MIAGRRSAGPTCSTVVQYSTVQYIRVLVPPRDLLEEAAARGHGLRWRGGGLWAGQQSLRGPRPLPPQLQGEDLPRALLALAALHQSEVSSEVT